MEKYFLFLLAIGVFTACNNSISDQGNSIHGNATLNLGETKYNVTTENTVSLDSVLSDSRCPIDVQCIWAGNAAARFTFLDHGHVIPFTLNTNAAFPVDTLISGYRIRLIDLKPAPHSGVVIKQSDYKADLLITKE